METKTLAVLACLTVVLLVQGSYGLKCYSCTACNDPFDKSNIQSVDCPNGSCMKVKTETSGIPVVVRSCVPSKKNDDCKSASEGGVSDTTCFCSTDLCNVATTSTVSVTAMLALVAGIFMFKNIL